MQKRKMKPMKSLNPGEKIISLVMIIVWGLFFVFLVNR